MELPKLTRPELPPLTRPSGPTFSNIPEGQAVENTDMSGATGWEMHNAKWKKIPSFMTKIKALGSATAQGLAEWGTVLNNMVPRMHPEEKTDTSAVDYWSDINKQYDKEYHGLGGYQVAGKLIPELAAFATVDKGRSLLSKPIEAVGNILKGTKIPGTNIGIPGVNVAGKTLEKIGQGPTVIGQSAPFYTKTVTEYGSAIGRDLTTFATVEGLKYDPENPEAGFNSDKALEMLENPLAITASVVGHKFGKWTDASRTLGKAKDTYSPYATAYQLKDQGPTRELEAKALGVLPNLFGVGKLVDQIHNLSNDTRTFIGNMLGNPEIKRGVDAGEKAGRYVQAALKRTKLTEDHAWHAVPQDIPIKDTQEIKDGIIRLVEDLKSNAPIDAKLLNPLETFGNKSSFTSGDVKKIHSKIGNILGRLYQHDDVSLMMGEGGIIGRLKSGKNDFLNILQTNLDETGNIALSKARIISAQNFDLMGISPLIPKAVENGVAAQQIADKMISEATGGKVMSPVFGKMSETGKNAVAKYKLLKSLDKHTKPDGSVELDAFLKETGDLSNTGNLMGKDTLSAFQGFNKYLQGVSEAAHTGWWTQATIAGTAGAGAVSKGGTSKILATAVAASYPVLGFIANHSPLKTLLHAATRKLPDSTYNTVMRNIEKYLTRGGFYITDGVIDKQPSNTKQEKK